MTALLDTGPLVAAMDRGDTHHTECVRLLEVLPGPLLLPTTVLIEACWVVNAHVGVDAHAALLDAVGADLASGRYRLVELTAADITRMAALGRTYRDARLDPTDVSVVACAERLQVHQVATLRWIGETSPSSDPATATR